MRVEHTNREELAAEFDVLIDDLFDIEPRTLGGPGSGRYPKGSKQFYHGTLANAVDSIKKNGLDPSFSGARWTGFSKSGHVYVTSDLAQAKEWAREVADKTGGTPVVVAVEVPEGDERLAPDSHFKTDPPINFQFAGGIPPEWIRDVEVLPSWADWLKRAAGRVLYIPLAIVTDEQERDLGGPGSGNFGHSGRPGQVGGSGGSGNGSGGRSERPLEQQDEVFDFFKPETVKGETLQSGVRADAPKSLKELAEKHELVAMEPQDFPPDGKFPGGELVFTPLTMPMPPELLSGIDDGLSDLMQRAPLVYEELKGVKIGWADVGDPRVSAATWGDKAIVFNAGAAEDLTLSKGQSIASDIALEKGTRADYWRAATVHEAGHVFDASRGYQISTVVAARVLADRAAAKQKGVSESQFVRQSMEELSEYALVAPQEFVAELFAASVYDRAPARLGKFFSPVLKRSKS